MIYNKEVYLSGVVHRVTGRVASLQMLYSFLREKMLSRFRNSPWRGDNEPAGSLQQLRFAGKSEARPSGKRIGETVRARNIILVVVDAAALQCNNIVLRCRRDNDIFVFIMISHAESLREKKRHDLQNHHFR